MTEIQAYENTTTSVEQSSDIMNVHPINIQSQFQEFIPSATATFTLNEDINRIYCCIFVKRGLHQIRIGGTNWKNDNNDHIVRLHINGNSISPFKKITNKGKNRSGILLDRVDCVNNTFIYKAERIISVAMTPVAVTPEPVTPVAITPVAITPEPVTPEPIRQRNSPPPVIQHRYRQSIAVTPEPIRQRRSPPPVIQHRYRQPTRREQLRNRRHSRRDIINFMDYLIHYRYSRECTTRTYENSISTVWSYLIRNEGRGFAIQWFYNNRIPTRIMRRSMRR